MKRYDLILHHKIELTEENVNDYSISLNPDNIMIVSHKTHNSLHDRFDNHRMQEVFIVYGAPLSGKTTWVSENKGDGDLIVDMDNIWQCITGGARYYKPDRLKAVAFRIRDAELDAVKYRLGKWRNAYIIGGYPLQSERERLAADLRAREIYIDATKEECLQRLEQDGERDKDEWRKYIDRWFESFGRE
ncbi:MAG: HNH endonuclease [Ruminococcus sp.]|nr:HNH endonuclease [Ruminococcus sp.]